VNHGCEVSILAMNTVKHYVDFKALDGSCDHYKEIFSVEVDNRIKIPDAFLNLFTSASYHVSRFVSAEYERKLKEVLSANNYDIVQLETMYLTPYIKTIRKMTSAKVVLRSHNIEHEIWKRITENTSAGLKKVYLKYLTGKLKKYELSHLNDYDSLITVSNRDLAKLEELGYNKKGISIPIGLQLKNYPLKKENLTQKGDLKICFIGAMDWIPNREGLIWFLNEVWPRLTKAYPTLELHIAGRNTDKDLKNLEITQCVHHGEVDSAISFISAHDIMIVPLLSGSGTRVKILESLALGVPVVSTSVGYEGIDLKDQSEILKADSADAFIEAFSRLMEYPKLKEDIKRNGRNHIVKHYDYDKTGSLLKDYYLEILSDD
jgi:glycosyltransferase involved in cell wall biosynthesis